MRVHRPLYAGQCLSGIIKSAAAADAAAADDDDDSVTIRGLYGPDRPSARPGPARPGNIVVTLNFESLNFYG